jgi:hypothetical protein
MNKAAGVMKCRVKEKSYLMVVEKACCEVISDPLDQLC